MFGISQPTRGSFAIAKLASVPFTAHCGCAKASKMSERTYWRRCGSCRVELEFEKRYYQCSVSGCQRQRTGLVFCSVSCWEAHRASSRHRDAWAETIDAPTQRAFEVQLEADIQRQQAQRERAQRPNPAASSPQIASDASELATDVPKDVLVVVSKLKEFVRQRSGMKVSDQVSLALSDYLRELADRGILAARSDGRKTVLDRDIAGLFPTRANPSGDQDQAEPAWEVLVVVSKLKKYIRARAGMNTSDAVARVLTDELRRVSTEAIRAAGADERRTVMDRDVWQALGR